MTGSYTGITLNDWSICRHTECGAGGEQTRLVWCERVTDNVSQPDSEGIRVTDSKCPARTRPDDTQACFSVCDFHRYQYQWKIDEWSKCRPRSGKYRCEEHIGIRIRNVTCLAKCGGVAPSESICDSFVPKPDTEQSCEQECPRDCIASDFGPWTSCDTCWVRNSTRFRTVVGAPVFSGKDCEDMTETKTCPKVKECDEYRSDNYQYKLGNWTECLSYHGTERRNSRGFTSVLGHRRRTVDCVNNRGILVEKGFCSHLDHPPSVQLCVLPRDCLVSHWSNWTSFSQSVATPISQVTLKRHRNVIQLPLGNGHVCPELQQSHDEQAQTVTSCDGYRWIRGNWGDCQLQVKDDACGTGFQTRPVLCVRNADTVPVADHLCAYEAPIHTRSCPIPCPQDCLVAQWLAWGECLPERCRQSRSADKSGYRVRTRLIMRESGHGGASCPHLKETQDCDYPLCYTWRVRTQGECLPTHSDMLCGDGYQARQIDCINRIGEVVSNRNCFETLPPNKEACYVPCAQDCVASEWMEWSTCSESCGFGRNAGHRTRSKEILTEATGVGVPCLPLRLLMEKERCNDFPCDTYHWHAAPWSECRLAVTEDRCGSGRHEREVTCYGSIGEKAHNRKCPLTEMPATSQNCTVPCPRNCVFSAFTDWSQCPVTCLKDDAKMLPEQQRWRFVLEHPSPGGVPCPELIESRPCMNLPRCASYYWRVSDWSQCMYATHYDSCGDGYRAREVRCINDREEALPEEICVSQLGSMPPVTQRCHVAECEQNTCKFSDWSAWNGCTQRCGGHSTRTRQMEGLTNRIMSCYDRAIYPLDEKMACECPSFTRKQVGNWSSCILENQVDRRNRRPDPDGYYNNSKSVLDLIGRLKPGHGHCGAGWRTQAIICQSPSLNVSAMVCESMAFAEEMCFITCPQDCVMSEWTEWDICVSKQRCGIGRQTRSRYQIESSLDGGRQCPEVKDGEEYESKTCYIACEQYSWVVEPWSVCSTLRSLATGDNCGPGLQSRIVRCMHTRNDLDPVEVREYYCDPRTKPSEVEHCVVTCPGHCVLSIWSEWSQCPPGCSSKMARHRTRTVQRPEVAGSGTPCPPLQEVEYCQQGVNCHLYAWSWSDWSVCVADTGVTCGLGRRQRHSECRRNDGQPMPKEYCKNVPVRAEDLVSEESCQVPCPVDCVLSEWTEWTTCSKSCDLGYQSRSRNVLVHSAHRGRLCPDPLSQIRPCPYVECFHWAVSDWTACKIESGSCGFGTQSRNLSCVRHDGVSVDISLCPEEYKAHFMLEQTCLLSCPGDCVMSQWSSWGPCHRPCEAADNTDGTQSRSRVILALPRPAGEPCPSNLVESRRCRGGTCPSYHWQSTTWFGDRRSVWCRRSDGMRVYGGCKQSTKPTSFRACTPECSIPYTYCKDINECACEYGFQAVYEAGRLVWCEKMVVTHNQTDKDGVDVENQALLLPSEDGPTNVWMYAVIAAGSAFVIFVIVTVYTILKHSRKEGVRSRVSAPTSTNARRRLSDASANGMPLVQQVPPMTHIDTYFELEEGKT